MTLPRRLPNLKLRLFRCAGIARAAGGIGIDSVGIYTTPDAHSLHTTAATEAVEIGGEAAAADPVAAYLDVAALIDVALRTGADCVHPGYGFVSESAHFAEQCAANGITFIGPHPAALALFGDKVAARALAIEVGVPVVPGSAEALNSAEDAAAAISEVTGLDYPVMLKASAGGGGRGIRVVESEADLAAAFETCRREALAAFGDGSVFVEQFVTKPRHIEVQILADTAGNVVHLFERDCSVQLRHQKVLEVAPAPGLDPTLRSQLQADAIKLAKASNYSCAGTVEFLVQPETGAYFFIECNPRIQVEHTVTEQVTGVDLVESQFRLAGGATLSELGLTQDAISCRGYSIQARVVASGTGTLRAYKEPSGAGIRVDGCGYVGFTPAPQFDPLLAKVICSHPSDDLEIVIERSIRALQEFYIDGVPTNLPPLCAILAHPDFKAGDCRTSLLSDYPALMLTTEMSSQRTADLLAKQAGSSSSAAGGGSAALALDVTGSEAVLPQLDVGVGEEAVECPVCSECAQLLLSALCTWLYCYSPMLLAS